MWNKRLAAALFLAASLCPGVSLAADEEGCLLCHRLELRSASVDGGFDLSVSNLRAPPHDPLHCSDCHADAKAAPHVSTPGPAGCIGECHSPSASAAEAHRAASFGGMTESHRKASVPRAPCRLCHKADDRPGGAAAVVERCGGCHARERDSAEAGVHSGIGTHGVKGDCTLCHVAHPRAAKEGQAAAGRARCDGKECHAGVSPGMRRLAGHAPEVPAAGAADRAAEAGGFLAIVALGALSSRRFCWGERGGDGTR